MSSCVNIIHILVSIIVLLGPFRLFLSNSFWSFSALFGLFRSFSALFGLFRSFSALFGSFRWLVEPVLAGSNQHISHDVTQKLLFLSSYDTSGSQILKIITWITMWRVFIHCTTCYLLVNSDIYRVMPLMSYTCCNCTRGTPGARVSTRPTGVLESRGRGVEWESLAK